MISRRAVLAGLAGAGLAGAAPAGQARALDRQEPRGLAIESAPFASFSAGDRDRRQFGALTFLGGLELRSRDPEFGGLSGLVLDPNGERFLIVTDHGHWLGGRIVQKDSVPLGIEAARIGPLRAPDGRRLKDTRYFDCESVFRQGQTLFVGVERVHDILQFDLSPGGEPMGRARLSSVPAEMKGLMPNGGIEALGLVPQGSEWSGHMLALAEKEARDQAPGQIPGFLIGPKSGRVWLRRIGDFDVTDLAFLPDGDLLVLERRFVPLFGVGFRIRRIPLAMIRSGAVLDGPALIVADLSMQIDNMEALAVHRSPQGRTILTLVSDNNFSLLQRNLLLRFALDG